jgi:Phosphatidylethanolamine-binding protein
MNSFDTLGYTGPCPPGTESHHYVFRLYALDVPLDLPPGKTSWPPQSRSTCSPRARSQVSTAAEPSDCDHSVSAYFLTAFKYLLTGPPRSMQYLTMVKNDPLPAKASCEASDLAANQN